MHSSRSKSPSPGRPRHDPMYRRKSPRGRSRSPIQQHHSSSIPSSSSHNRIVSSVQRSSLSKEMHQPRGFERSARARDRDRHSPETIQSRRSSLPSHEPFIAAQRSSNSLSQDIDLSAPSAHERHNPGSTGPLPAVEELRKFEIQLKNPAADGNSPQNDSVKVSIEDVKIPRHYGEGEEPIFAFLTPVRRVVVIRPSEVSLSADDSRSSRVPSSPKPHDVLDRRDSKRSPSHSGHPRSSSSEPVRVKVEWERERDLARDKYREQDRDKYRDQERNGDKEVHRGDYSRRLSRDGERSRYEVEPYRSRDKERERERDHERDRERERERARERGRDRDFERVKDRERVREKEGDRDNDRNLSKDKDHDKNPRSKSESRVKSESSNKSEPGTPEDHGERRSRDSGVMQHYPHPQGPYMDHGPRIMAPVYRPPMRHPMRPPFIGRPFGPYGPYGPPGPMFFPPRMPPRPPRN